MSTTVLSTINVTAPSVSLSANSYLNLQLATDTPAVQQAVSLAIGSTAGSVNARFSATLAIVSGSAYTINLLTGTDQYGNTIAMVHASLVYVVNNSTTTAQILTVGAGTHPVLGSDQFTVQPNGGCGFLLNPNPGYSIVTSSSDTLQITNASGTCSVSLVVLGRTS